MISPIDALHFYVQIGVTCEQFSFIWSLALFLRKILQYTKFGYPWRFNCLFSSEM